MGDESKMKIRVPSHASVRLSYFTVFILLSAFVYPALAQPRRSKIYRVNFEPGQSSTVLRGSLRPYANHIYRLQARQGQRMTVRVQSPVDDVVFWVKTKGDARGRYSLVLEGIHRNGVTEWSGELPSSAEYEIHVSNPHISDHVVRRTLRYQVELRIE